MASATRSRRTLFRAVAIACLVVIGVQTAGCGFFSGQIDRQYYLIEPSLVSLGEGRIPCEAKYKPGKDESSPQTTDRASALAIELKASDTLVIIYADCLKKMLRARMNLARIARLTSSSFAVLTAAAAAALGAVATAPLTAITALAATSAVIPEFMRIFGADERAKAYDEGIHLIEGAEGQYLQNLTEHAQLVIPRDHLTADGAQLYVQVVAALKIVENLLVAQLPKVEDIELAQGRIRRIAEVRVSLTQKVEPPMVVKATDGTTTGTTREVKYTAKATNVTAAAVGPAILEVTVDGLKDWKPTTPVTVSNNATCDSPVLSISLTNVRGDVRCEITSLAASGAVDLTVTVVAPDAPDATAPPKRILFTGRVWEKSSKLLLSGPGNPQSVNVNNKPAPAQQ